MQKQTGKEGESQGCFYTGVIAAEEQVWNQVEVWPADERERLHPLPLSKIEPIKETYFSHVVVCLWFSHPPKKTK